jgi:hypothetical protein
VSKLLRQQAAAYATQTLIATINPATDLGSFFMSVSSQINAGALVTVNVDEFRFGMALLDVVPEPSVA